MKIIATRKSGMVTEATGLEWAELYDMPTGLAGDSADDNLLDSACGLRPPDPIIRIEVLFEPEKDKS